MSVYDKYGPWALIAGASDGIGSAFAERLADNGINVVLLARRQKLLDEVATGIAARTGVRTRTVSVDLTKPDATSVIVAATEGLEIGFLVYCAGADSNYQPFLDSPVETAVAMVRRNCLIPMQLCHHFAAPMVARGGGGIVIVGSLAGLVGGPNMVAYGASKAFDMVFAESMWAELNPQGIDVLGLILGKTDTPALRELERRLGSTTAADEPLPGAMSVRDTIAEAFDNLENGPTWIVGEEMRGMAKAVGAASRSDAVKMLTKAAAGLGGGDAVHKA